MTKELRDQWVCELRKDIYKDRTLYKPDGYDIRKTITRVLFDLLGGKKEILYLYKEIYWNLEFLGDGYSVKESMSFSQMADFIENKWETLQALIVMGDKERYYTIRRIRFSYVTTNIFVY